MSEFKIPSISTLIGSDLGNFLRSTKGQKLDRKFYKKYYLTMGLSTIFTPFHLWEHVKFGKKVRNIEMENPPVFILGHWRSGTTMLHNILCQDPDASYLTTFQSVFPNNLASKAIFKNYMRLQMPDRRPADAMKLNINFPQEDEFALANTTHLAYYHFFYFPKSYLQFWESSVGIENDPIQFDKWRQSYMQLMSKAYLNSKGRRLVVKNPVNTARIAMLLKIYPDAKFIYIHRDPREVILSTRRFFYALMPTLWLQQVSKEFIDAMIFDIYRRTIDAYSASKSMISPQNLFEIGFEDFSLKPLSYISKIYTKLLQMEFEGKKQIMEEYIASISAHSKKKYDLSGGSIQDIEEQLGDYIDMYNLNTNK